MNGGMISVFADDGSVFLIDFPSVSSDSYYVYRWCSDSRRFIWVYSSTSLDACYSFIYSCLRM